MNEQKFSRRNFLGLSAVGVAAVAGMGLAGCAPKTEAEAKKGAKAATVNSSGIEVDKVNITETISCDILVVGGGFAGLAAAVQAAENGDDVILIEAQTTLGGNGQGVEGTFAVDSKYQKEQGVTVDRSIIMQEELGKAQWVPNGLFYKDLIDHSGDNIQWAVETCGSHISGLIDNYPCGAVAGAVNTFHWWEEGAAYVGYIQPMEKKLRSLGASIDLNTRGLEFSYAEDGSVAGIIALDAFGDLVEYAAKAVILATGGFANDDKRLKKLGFDLNTLERIGTPGHYGDGVNMTLAAGASEFNGVCYLKYNRISHGSVEIFGPLWTGFCFGGPFLWLNEDGERFVDESLALRVGNVVTQSAPIHNQPNCTALSVFDQKVYDQKIAETKAMADEWGVSVGEQWKAILETGDDGFKADTLEELAEKAGVDPTAFKAGVEEYNAVCAAGVDGLYGKEKEYLQPITTPPYYIGRIHEVMEGPLGGVVCDRTFRPLLEEGGRLENVFVIGLDGIMLYRDVYPMDVPGSASAECLHGGRVSANEAHKIVAG
ncbi:MAG: FAD-dependent oxidoreductase [Gordonibacter sp.]